MNTNRITVRYAKALYDFASDEKKADIVNKDMLLLSELVNIPEFRNMLENPVIFPSKKIAVFEELMKNKADTVTIKFFRLLAENKREAYLGALARNYMNVYRKNNNIKAAELLTAFIADDELKKDVLKILEEQFKSKIDLKTGTNKDIIGGFVLTVDGLQYDTSVIEKLKEIKKEMLEA
jgi:F-type H+-transporting ATPase subunit delta